MKEAFEKLVRLVDSAGQIKGRKKFQKMVYLLQTAGFDFGKNFRYHYFGPYSTELQLEIDALVDRKFLEEAFDGQAYSYRVVNGTKESRSSSETDKSTYLVKYLNHQSPQVLELAATLIFLKDKGYGDFDKVTKKAMMLKPDLIDKLPKAKPVLDRIMSAARQ
jgi:hypothetical protein